MSVGRGANTLLQNESTVSMETSETTKKAARPTPHTGAKRAAQIYFVGAILKQAGVTLPSRLLLILIPRAVTDDVAGAALGFHVDLADVLADHAQADQLYAGNKADDAGHAGPAGYGGTQQRFHNGPDHADKADERHNNAKPGNEPDGLDGKAGDAVKRKGQHFGQGIVLSPAMRSWRS